MIARKLVTILALSVLPSASVALAGCAADADGGTEQAPPRDVQATDASLQALGVHYIGATGTVEDATLAFYDANMKELGKARVFAELETTRMSVEWKGTSWQWAPSKDGAWDDATVTKDGAEVDAADTQVGSELEEVENVVSLSLDAVTLPSHTARAQKKFFYKCKKSWRNAWTGRCYHPR